MQLKTTGIVLKPINYNDKSVIVTIYTKDLGRSTFIIYGTSGKRGNAKRSALMPLSIIEIEAGRHPGKDLQTIKEIRVSYPFTGISVSPVKNAIALFMSELLYKCIRQTEADAQMYEFLENAVKLLDHCEEGIANFHLIFMIKLSRYLGFEMNTENHELPVFDLLNGCFTGSYPSHPHYLSPELSSALAQVIPYGFSDLHLINLSRQKRNELLAAMLEYYKLHMNDFHGLKSTEILQELFI
jgi:DNA repair protein RecO (recombination protein O)